jgi:hypothetical protein
MYFFVVFGRNHYIRKSQEIKGIIFNEIGTIKLRFIDINKVFANFK